MRLSETPLLSAEAIQRRVRELAAEISEAYRGRSLRILVVLKGSVLFGSDLVRHLEPDLTLDFVRAKSYDGSESSGDVHFSNLWEGALTGQDVLLVEDILDTGRTATAILHRIHAENPASVAICTLLDKPTRRIEQVHGDYVGFDIEDHFVVGYGLDYNEHYRQLPALYILENE